MSVCSGSRLLSWVDSADRSHLFLFKLRARVVCVVFCLTLNCYIDRARGRRFGAKSNRCAITQNSSNSLIRFRCSNSCFLLETGIAVHERLLLAKWHPKAEKQLRKRRFFDTTDRHEKLYGRSRLHARLQGRHETGGVVSLFSSLSFDISTKNSVQRWSSDFQGLFRVKIRKMARRSNDLYTLPDSHPFLLPNVSPFCFVWESYWSASRTRRKVKRLTKIGW